MDMTEQGGVDRVWDLIEKVDVCMLTTQSAGRLRARPVEARPERKAGLIFIVTDLRSAKPDEIEANPDICLAFVDPKAKAYLSITRPRSGDTRYRKARAGLENNRHGVVAEWAHGSQCMLVANQATDRRIVGWTLERGDNDLRTRQGLVD